MKKEHIIPLRVSVDDNTGEEIWEERKYFYHELTYEEADRLEELRATMDDLEKQTFLGNKVRSRVSGGQTQMAEREKKLGLFCS